MDWAEHFDIIGGIDELIANIKNGRGVKIEWSDTPTTSGADGENLLRAYGIKCWGRQITNDERTKPQGIRVGPKQAAYADALLRVAGFPVTSPHLGKSFKVLPKAWMKPAKPVGMRGQLVNLIGGGPNYKQLKEQRSHQVARQERQQERKQRRGR